MSKNLSMEEQIEFIVEDMNTWSRENLLDWAKDVRLEMLRNVSESVVQGEYDALMDDKPWKD